MIDFNKYALDCVNNDKLEEAHTVFSKLVQLCTQYCKVYPKFMCLTYNNLSWLYKKNGCMKKAMKYLTKALAIARDLNLKGWSSVSDNSKLMIM